MAATALPAATLRSAGIWICNASIQLLLACQRRGVALQRFDRLFVLAVVQAADLALAVDQDEVLVVDDRRVGRCGDRGEEHFRGQAVDRVLRSGDETPARLVA